MTERVLRDELGLVRSQERQSERSLSGRKDSGDKGRKVSHFRITILCHQSHKDEARSGKQ